jgi:hypothetical protein
MAYEPTVWENREVERPRTYIMTENADGTVTLTPSEGQVFSAGTPLDASNLNKLEQAVANNDANKVSKAGDTMTGNLTAPILNATSALQESGVSLANIYQPKGNYAPTGQYAVWVDDPNGVRLDIGTHAGKKYEVFFTSAQPPAGGTGFRRIWIQTDA